MDEAVRRALRRDRTIDITTIGRKSGRPRRMETWVYRLGEQLYLTGPPGWRDWYANLLGEPGFTYHLKGSVIADLPARATPVRDPAQRREILRGLFPSLEREGQLNAWVAHSPLLQIEIDLIDDDKPAHMRRPVDGDNSTW